MDRWRARNAAKRGGGEVVLALEELSDCVSGTQSTEQLLQNRELISSYQAFLDTLPVTQRRVFLCRYWYLEPIETIAQRFGFSRSKVKSMLHRIRGKLRAHLEKEGYLS